MFQWLNNHFQQLVERLVLFSSFLVQKLLYRSKLPKFFVPKRILVIKLDHFGDLLISTAVFNNLHLNFPTAAIDALVGHWGQTVLENHPYIHQLIFYNSPFFSRQANRSNFGATIRLLFQLWQKYDLVVDLRGDYLTIIMALLKSSSYRLDRASRQIEQKLSGCSSVDQHEIDRQLDLLSRQQLRVESRLPVFYPSSEDQDWADAYRSTLPINQPLVIIHPGSPVALKRWPPKCFAELASWLINTYQATVIFVGDVSENELIKHIQELMVQQTVNLTGLTSFGQLASLLKKAELFIGNDSAPMHLAAMMGTTVLALYGPSDPKRFGPLGINSHTIRKKNNCPPCMSNYCWLNGLGCMKDISLSDVQKSVALLLQL